MKKFLDKKIVIRKTVGQILKTTLFHSICFIVLMFFLITTCNAEIINALEMLIDIFNSIEAGKISVLEFSVIFAPMIIVLFLTIKLGIVMIQLDDKRYKSKK